MHRLKDLALKKHREMAKVKVVTTDDRTNTHQILHRLTMFYARQQTLQMDH